MTLLGDFAARCEVEVEALQAWALADLGRFWTTLLEWSALPHEGSTSPALVGQAVEHARFFPELRLNYAEALLAGGEGEALLSVCEGRVERMSWATLRERVEAAAAGLRALGIEAGDRVVAVAPNTAESVIACLASAAIGATWSSTAPDLAPDAILQRFGQIAPRVLFTCSARTYQGREQAIDVPRLVAELPSLEVVIALDEPPEVALPTGLALEQRRLRDLDGPRAPFERLPFDHPLFILFSSGTTGAPKCIVHGAGGTLLEHVKEHRLHCDLRPGDTLYYSTTAGWMMWNWLVSGLASGARLVLYEGAVSYPREDEIVQLLAEEGVTHFGTSPIYLQYLADRGIHPKERLPLPELRAILSTGSILYPEQYDWVAEHFAEVPLQSISGGTDIVGCFVLGHPERPVVRGRSQAITFGYDVQVMGPEGPRREGMGELVCVQPFVSRPLGLFDDPEGARFHAAYFAENEGVWTHGDFLELTADGGARVLGRSDGVMNLRGVRVGPAEIYSVLQSFPDYAAAMAVTQPDARSPGGQRLLLLVVMSPGRSLERPLILKTKKALKTQASAYHVPGLILAVEDLPTTHSGKRSERAVQDLLDGRPIRNRSALRNPESLDAIASLLS